jgi:2-dehydropantoate 2-reductase
VTRYVFIGAGAIGSAVGGMLADSGSEVLLVARGEHARTMINSGLRLRCPDTALTVRPPVITDPTDARLTEDDVLVLSTKTHQAEAAIDQWADVPVHREDKVIGRAADLLPIVTALNGVASEDIALRYFAWVFGACVWCPAVMIDPGEVFLRAAPLRGVFHIGPYPKTTDPRRDAGLLTPVISDWRAAGFRITTPASVMPWKYCKLLTNLGNAVMALLGDTSDADDIKQAVDAEAREVLAAARITVTTDEQEAAARAEAFTVSPVPGEPEQLGGSSWQSLVRGTGSIETDYLNGEISVIARRIGWTAPLNARLTALARQAARNRQLPGAISTEQLRAELGLPGRS